MKNNYNQICKEAEYKQKFLTEKNVSRITGYSRSTLQSWRWEGKGPKFIKVGNRVLYPTSSIDEFFDQFSLQQSTSETNYIKGNN